jgi:hypothetical protein
LCQSPGIENLPVLLLWLSDLRCLTE